MLPEGFVFLSDIDATIIENVRYSTDKNFLGRKVSGYTTESVICTTESANRLKIVNDSLKSIGYKLVVYDGYRPQRAVDEFVMWCEGDGPEDRATKELYYPAIHRNDIVELGYIARRSSHSRGSTFDLTLIDIGKNLSSISCYKRTLRSGEEIFFLDDNTVDMGSSFDLFHESSNHDSKLVYDHHLQMREVLREAMKKHGFKDNDSEWWHYTLEDEPYKNDFFDFVYVDRENL